MPKIQEPRAKAGHRPARRKGGRESPGRAKYIKKNILASIISRTITGAPLKMRGKIMTGRAGLLTNTAMGGYKYIVLIQESHL